MRAILTLLLVASTAAAVAGADRNPRSGIDWPQFRGIGANGVADGTPTALRWNAETGEHVKWKAPVPGLGHSSPIVWGDLLCVSSAISNKQDVVGVGIYIPLTSVEDASPQRWEVHCFDKHTGRIRWVATAREGVPTVKRHAKSSHANSTLATDGTHVIALFGSEGLYCFDMRGRLRWKKDLGVLDSGYFQDAANQWAFGSSPIIADNKVIVQADVQRGSFIAAFDISTGRQLWRTERDEVPTWSTPTVAGEGERVQVVVNGYRQIGGYDLATGESIWWMQGGGDIPVPTPVVSQGTAFITNNHGKGSPILAIRTDAVGELPGIREAAPDPRVVWRLPRGGSYIQTPLVYRDYLYVPGWMGVLGVYDAKTGARIYQQRLGSGLTLFSSSPVAAEGHVYIASEEGSVYVIKAGPVFELVAENPMGEMCLATPAISEGVLYFRTRGHIVAIAN